MKIIDMANYRQSYSNQRDDEMEKIKRDYSELSYKLKQSRKNCSRLFQEISTANINLKERDEHVITLQAQLGQANLQIANLTNLYARAQANVDLDTVNVKLANAIQDCNKKKEDCEQLKAELYEKCEKIGELENKLKNAEEQLEMEISSLKLSHKSQVENYEQKISKSGVELEELRKLVRDSSNIGTGEKDTKVLILEAHIQKDVVVEGKVGKELNVVEVVEVNTQEQDNLVNRQNDYIKTLEEFNSMFGEAMDENYLLQKEIQSKDEKYTDKLMQAAEFLKEYQDNADKYEERLKASKLREEERAKSENDVQKMKAVLVERNEQLDKFVGFLETVKDIAEFTSDDNCPLINQLDELKECLSEKLKVLLLVDKVQKPPTSTPATTTVKTAKQPILKKKKRQLHAEDLTKRVTGRGPENRGAKYYCLCKKFWTYSKEQLQEHILHESQKRKFQCEKCTKRFLLMGHLDHHLRSVHGMQFEVAGGCRSCGILFKSREEKDVHQRSHANSEIILHNKNEQHMKTEASNLTEEHRLPAAPPAPPTSTAVNPNRYSGEHKKSSRPSGGVAREKEQSHHRKNENSRKENEPSSVRNSSSSAPPPPPPSKRRRVSTDSAEDDEVDIIND